MWNVDTTYYLFTISYAAQHMARQRCVRLSFLLSEVPFYRESVVYIDELLIHQI